MQKLSKYYHIYNHANGFENIFNEERNYRFFLEKYQFYISPIADTLAYCLMPNHFHFLIKIKSEEELRGWLGSTSQKFADKGSQKTFEKFGVEKGKWKTFEKFGAEKGEWKTFEKFGVEKGEWKTFEKFEAEKIITKQFSKLFSCYTQSFNKVYNRRGSLFVPNYKRKEITSEEYLKQVFIYIHNNPVKHGFVRKPDEWNFSSYNAYIFEEENFVIKNHILNYFDSVGSLKAAHLDNLPLPDDFILDN